MSKKNDEQLGRIEENLSRILDLLLKSFHEDAPEETPEPEPRATFSSLEERNALAYKGQIMQLHNARITISEIANRIGVHRSTVRKYMKSYGVVPYRKQRKLQAPSEREQNEKLKNSLSHEGGQDA